MNPHPWGDFLQARAKALVWQRDVMHQTPEQIARLMSMDTMQVRLILDHMDNEAEKAESDARGEANPDLEEVDCPGCCGCAAGWDGPDHPVCHGTGRIKRHELSWWSSKS